MDRAVALKVLHALMRTKPLAVKRFFGEAKAATAIGHPGIVQVFDAGTSPEGHAFLAMELVDGCSLKELVQAGPIGKARAIRIVVDVLDALAAAHEVGIIHRDVKPGNIMLGGTTPDGSRSDDDVRLVDFGVSKARQTKDPDDITRSGMAMGSPGYASPEQYVSAKTADARSDIYGISVVLYQLLAGSLPFQAESYEQMVVQVCSKDPPSLARVASTIPPRLAAIVDRGVARDPDARWQRAEELRAALEPWIDKFGEVFGATEIAPSRPPPKMDTSESRGATPTFIEASPEEDDDGEADRIEIRAVTKTTKAEKRLPPRPRRRIGAIAGAGAVTAGVVLAIVVLVGVATQTDTTPADPGLVGSAPVPVAPAPVDEPTEPVLVSPSEPTEVEPPLEPATPALSATEAAAEENVAPPRRRRRPVMRSRAMVEMAGDAPSETTATMRGFGSEDIVPFDPD
jgi:serine/threonine-protein kinase